MKTLRILFSGVAVILWSFSVMATPTCPTEFGLMQCTDKISVINFKGMVHLEDLVVTHSFDVLGAVQSKRANITNMRLNGVIQMNDTTIHDLMIITGEMKASNVKVLAVSEISGSLLGETVVFDQFTKIIGTTKCDDCHFNDGATLVGNVKISNSSFNTAIDMKTKRSQFINTKLADVYVNRLSTLTNYDDDHPTLILSNSTANNIIFAEGSEGTVILKKGSQVLGKVINGKIING